MDEIASKLGMSKRTLYQYFADKEDMIIYFLDYHENKHLQLAQELSEKLPTMVEVMLQVIENHRGSETMCWAKFQEDIQTYFPRAYEKRQEQSERGILYIKDFLGRGINQGVFRQDLNLDVTAFLIQDATNTYIHASRMDFRPFSIWELFFNMMINFIRGISSEKGISIVDEYLRKKRTSDHN